MKETIDFQWERSQDRTEGQIDYDIGVLEREREQILCPHKNTKDHKETICVSNNHGNTYYERKCGGCGKTLKKWTWRG